MVTYFRFVLFLAMLQVAFNAGAQEFAMDFARTDCKGVEHHLFSELDSGKVIILDFVMLGCSPCFWATRDLDTIVKAFESTYPGRVKIYSFSYDSSHTCEQMNDWRNQGGFPDVVLFTHGNEMVSYYGGIGMPTIVVTGSSIHRVFYNGYGYSSADDSLIIAAIENALNYNQSGVNEALAQGGFKVYPTLFSERIFVETGEEFSGSEIIICDIYGRQVMSAAIAANSRLSIPAVGFSKGLYFARFKTGNGLSGGTRLIRQ